MILQASHVCHKVQPTYLTEVWVKRLIIFGEQSNNYSVFIWSIYQLGNPHNKALIQN